MECVPCPVAGIAHASDLRSEGFLQFFAGRCFGCWGKCGVRDEVSDRTVVWYWFSRFFFVVAVRGWKLLGKYLSIKGLLKFGKFGSYSSNIYFLLYESLSSLINFRMFLGLFFNFDVLRLFSLYYKYSIDIIEETFFFIWRIVGIFNHYESREENLSATTDVKLKFGIPNQLYYWIINCFNFLKA